MNIHQTAIGLITVYAILFLPIPTLAQDISGQAPFLQMKPGYKLSGVDVLARSDDGNLLAGAGRVFLRIWNTKNDELVLELTGFPFQSGFSGDPNHVTDMKFTPDGKELVVSCFQGIVIVIDIKTGKNRLVLRNPCFVHKDNYLRLLPFGSVAISEDGKHIAAGSYRQFHVWDAQTGKLKNSLFEERLTLDEVKVTEFRKAFIPDANPEQKYDFMRSINSYYLDYGDTTTTIFQLITNNVPLYIEKRSLVYDIAFGLNANEIITAGLSVCAWDFENNTRRILLNQKDCNIALSRDGNKLLIASDELRVLDASSLKLLRKHSIRLKQPQFFSGNLILGIGKGSLQEFDIVTGKVHRKFVNETVSGEPRLYAISCHPMNSTIFAAYGRRYIYSFNPDGE